MSLSEEDYLADKRSWTPQVHLLRDLDGEEEKKKILIERTIFLLEKMTSLEELDLTKEFHALMDTNDMQDRFWDEYKRLKLEGYLSKLNHVKLHSTGVSSVFILLETDSVQHVTLTFEPDVRFWSPQKVSSEMNKLRAYALTLPNVNINVNVPAHFYPVVKDRFTVQAIDTGRYQEKEESDESL